MDIVVKVIDNSQHRSNITGADWWYDDDGNLQVRISKMSDPRHESALALHEVFEALLCHFQDVKYQEVDAFDIPYEATHDKKCNAGDEPDCPYRTQHGFATAAERIFTTALGINWLSYDKEIESL